MSDNTAAGVTLSVFTSEYLINKLESHLGIGNPYGTQIIYKTGMPKYGNVLFFKSLI